MKERPSRNEKRMGNFTPFSKDLFSFFFLNFAFTDVNRKIPLDFQGNNVRTLLSPSEILSQIFDQALQEAYCKGQDLDSYLLSFKPRL